MFLDPNLSVGGVERLMQTLFRNVDRSRIEPVVCGLFKPGPIAEEFSRGLGLRVYHSLGKNRRDPFLFPRLLKVLRAEKPDIVFTCIYPVTMYMAALARLCGQKFKIVAAVHSTGYIKRAAWRSFWTHLSAPLLSAVVTIARSQTDVCAERLRIPRRKLHLIYNGVELERFSPDRVSGSVREEFSIPSDALLVGTVGMLRPEKAHHVFLRAADIIRRGNDRVRFMLVGDGPERERLEALASELGLTDVVAFAGGRSDIPEILSALDLFVLPSDTEAFPVSVLEAMAMEKPVVSTDVGSVSEAVSPGETGLLVPPGQPGALAEAVSGLMRDPALCRRMGLAGRRVVEDSFSVEVMAGKYEELFVQVVKGVL